MVRASGPNHIPTAMVLAMTFSLAFHTVIIGGIWLGGPPIEHQEFRAPLRLRLTSRPQQSIEKPALAMTEQDARPTAYPPPSPSSTTPPKLLSRKPNKPIERTTITRNQPKPSQRSRSPQHGSHFKRENVPPRPKMPNRVSPSDIPATHINRPNPAHSGESASPPSSSSNDLAIDSPLEPIYSPAPAYPRMARRFGLEGKVVLHVSIDRLGHPSEIKIRSSSGSRILDHAAVEAIRQWRFRIRTSTLHMAKEWIDIPVLFRLKSE